MNIKEKIKKLPSSPGVYLMKDSIDTIIYVGKSKNLRNRVGSYFINSKSHSPKVIKLVKNLKDFDYILTDTEFEALLLECKLIKEIKPIYNRQMKSPKGYCYIKIKMKEKYPDIEIHSEPNSSDGGLYFGPYTNKNTVEKAIYGIKEHSKILCTNGSRKALGCLKYSMNLCIGMCTANPSTDHYFALVEKVIKLLSGTDLTILNEMEQEMNVAAANLDFEGAAKYRDYIKAVKHLVSTAKIIKFIEANKNIVLVEFLNNEEIKFFLIRYNKLLFSEKYKLSNISINELKHKFKSNIISYFSDTLKSSVNIGKNEIDEAYIIYNYLKSKESTCKYIAIPEQWINDMDSLSVDRVIDEFMKILP
ncbi:excinuclease ABC subunit C [Clostridium tetanomorphum]|uniref:UvrB/UvrC motif-containing protein n=1 Tax=Clostridium tetanomorphum TaxID=1553 RepID=UPI000445CEA9|nr:UvrB/UvrC motif-containing protein [Clostridium tetanomorphum]KAJ49117.1 Excinuclease ABC, subunit C [Clostridium tetanomorphum DSM 665]KAJ50235.1 Excinuclease ABC, subunit C [Clostridium tetanomorphum DSM 665]MBP1864375.1 excinuclease ABC subunit C [Clostridium tetanomorphum]NRS83821.1 excinuclease ABC subunit C [Clostridium tetanomorphum]SQC02248.1 excinuclease ABC subunit C [Clostridium tetanomorphum]